MYINPYQLFTCRYFSSFLKLKEKIPKDEPVRNDDMDGKVPLALIILHLNYDYVARHTW